MMDPVSQDRVARNELPNHVRSWWNRLVGVLRSVRYVDVGFLLLGIAVAVALRYVLLDFKSSDFNDALRPWYGTIREMGFSAFGTDFSTYNPPYLYELYLIARLFPDLPNVVAVKIPSLLGDFICAYFVYRILASKYPDGPLALLGAFAFLCTPTVVLNSAFWGQADVLFAAPLIACLFFLMRKQNALALLAFGLALAFKLQAIFFAPLLLALWLRRRLSWKDLLMIPLVLLAALIPSWLAGRPLADLVRIYFSQADQYGQLQMHAPTVYAWLPEGGLTERYFGPAGVLFAVAAVLVYAVLVGSSKAPLTDALLVKLSLLSVLLVPFFLPRMHERYFYAADVIAILYALYLPRRFYVPIVVVMMSFFAYQPALFGAEIVPMGFLSVGMFAMLLVVARDCVQELFSSPARVDTLQTQ